MNIVLDPLSFNPENLFFMEKKKNNIIDGFFSKMVYSSDLCTINGLFYILPLIYKPTTELYPPHYSALSYNDHKHSVSFYTHNIKNLQYISMLSGIEIAIINSYKELTLSKKRNVLGLTTQLYKGYFKVYGEKRNGNANLASKKYVVKISGVWETAEEIGLTYKFMEIYGEPI
jgi:hypothetical protein